MFNLLHNYDIAKLGYIALGIASSYSFVLLSEHFDNSDDNIKDSTRKMMDNDFMNKIILWKRENKEISSNYHLFIKDMFPENIKFVNNNVDWIDPRVMGPRWKGVFDKLSYNTKLYKLS